MNESTPMPVSTLHKTLHNDILGFKWVTRQQQTCVCMCVSVHVCVSIILYSGIMNMHTINNPPPPHLGHSQHIWEQMFWASAAHHANTLARNTAPDYMMLLVWFLLCCSAQGVHWGISGRGQCQAAPVSALNLPHWGWVAAIDRGPGCSLPATPYYWTAVPSARVYLSHTTCFFPSQSNLVV